ncbi:hypothetical protein [Streptomyces sp. WELS2]|uniref:wHTH domain-containing protein n=1 Tax=Streptomyces sp. WELS2 TaxID=2749435 RepID=UPI00215D6C72|nr:hypothetical protein [Streptomyces sp. WELS2]
MRHTWQRRVTPYLCLEEVPPSITGVPDVVPGWQDLAILSAHLDGRLPQTAGAIGRDRIEQCARAVAETPEWVRGRLEVYAEMFGLRFESADAPGERAGEREGTA